jgi:hypothetical protein
VNAEQIMAVLDRVKALVEVVDDGARPDGSDVHEVAEGVVAGLARDELDVMAAWWLADEVRSERRARTYRAEREAERVAQATEQQRRAEHERANDPRRMTEAEYHTWVESTDEGRAHAERQQAEAEAHARIDEEFRREVDQVLADYAEHLRMEWTEELLASGFALPSGQVVTWGEATVAQHRQRAAMFASNAEANLRGAARHRHAVEALESAGASCLRELVEGAA